MPNLNYPGVYGQEIDNSFVSTIDNTSVVGVMGRALQGLPNAKVLVHSQAELIGTFGNPIVSGSYPLVSAIDYGIYAGLEALKETNNLYYVRLTDGSETYANVTVPTTGVSAVSGTVSVLSAAASTVYPTLTGDYIEGNISTNNYDLAVLNGVPSGLRFSTTGPGAYGNNVAIAIWTTACGTSSYSATYGGFYDWDGLYDDAAITSNRLGDRVFKVQVFTKGSNQQFNTAWWNSVSGAPVETFYGTTNFTDNDLQGNSLFIQDVINGKSQYIYVTSNKTDGTVPAFTLSGFGLTGGSNTSAFSTLNASTVWQIFGNRETSPLDVAIVIPRAKDSKSDPTEVAAVDALLSQRYDFFSTVQATSLTATNAANIINENALITIASNPSYFGKYVGWNQVLDRYNSSKVYLPNAIYAGAIMARVDRLGNSWDAPAGVERGIIPSGKQNVNLTPSVAGPLYAQYNLNTVKFIAGYGSIVWGQKTAQLKATARNRINVRRLLITTEKNITRILNGFLFQGNTPKSRQRVTSLITSYLQTVLAKGGLQSFKVVCDDSNNTSTSIAQNILNVDVYVQPTYTIEFIQFNTIISSNDVSTSEVQ